MGETNIRLLGISGSPRLKATHYAVNEALGYAHERYGVEVDYFSVHAKSIIVRRRRATLPHRGHSFLAATAWR
jgi:hypothetical protein